MTLIYTLHKKKNLKHSSTSNGQICYPALAVDTDFSHPTVLIGVMTKGSMTDQMGVKTCIKNTEKDELSVG